MTTWLVQTLAGTTLAMLAVLVLRGPVARLFGAHVAYALWLLPALRLVLPPLPGWTALWQPVFRLGTPTQIGIVDPATAVRLAALGVAEAPMNHDVAVAAAPIGNWAPDWPTTLLLLWVAGALVWFGWQMLRYRHFIGGALAEAELLSRQGDIDVLVSRSVDGPLAAGIMQRRIFLPADFLRRYTPDERRLVLLHEGAHHDRRDIAANLAAIAVVALHWWNPVAHWAYRAFRTDQELACDATVLAGASGAARHDYGSAVLKSVFTRTPAPVCALNHKTQLKQRIGMMKNRNIGRARLALGGLFAATMIGGGLLLTAAGDAKAPEAAATPVAPVAAVAPAPAEKPRTRVAVIVRDDDAKAAAEQRIVIRHRIVAVADKAAADRAKLAADAGAAGAAADKAGHEADRAVSETIAAMDIDGVVRSALASARSGLVVQCAAAGSPVDKDADWGNLATCGPQMRDTIKTSLQSARQRLAKVRGLTDSQRAAALSGLDEALAEIDNDPDLGRAN